MLNSTLQNITDNSSTKAGTSVLPQNHIMVWVRRALKIIQLFPHCHGQGHFLPHQVTQGPVQPGPKHPKGWGIHNFSPGSLFHCLTIPATTVKHFFLYLLYVFQFKAMSFPQRSHTNLSGSHLSCSLSQLQYVQDKQVIAKSHKL